MVDAWILSRLSHCVQLCHDGAEAYNFQQATTGIFNFWLYDFCDVYLESVKQVLAAGKPLTQYLLMSQIRSHSFRHNCHTSFF